MQDNDNGRKLYRVKCGKKDEQLAFILPNSTVVAPDGTTYIRVRWNTGGWSSGGVEETIRAVDIIEEVEVDRRSRRKTQGTITKYSPSDDSKVKKQSNKSKGSWPRKKKVKPKSNINAKNDENAHNNRDVIDLISEEDEDKSNVLPRKKLQRKTHGNKKAKLKKETDDAKAKDTDHNTMLEAELHEKQEQLAMAIATIEKQKITLDGYVNNIQTIESLRADLDKKQEALTQASNVQLSLVNVVAKLEVELTNSRDALYTEQKLRTAAEQAQQYNLATHLPSETYSSPSTVEADTTLGPSIAPKQEVKHLERQFAALEQKWHKKEEEEESKTQEQLEENFDVQASTIGNLQADVKRLEEEEESKTLEQRDENFDVQASTIGNLQADVKRLEHKCQELSSGLDRAEIGLEQKEKELLEKGEQVKQLEEDISSLQHLLITNNGGKFATTNLCRLSSLATGSGMDFDIKDSTDSKHIEQTLAGRNPDRMSELIHNLFEKNQRLHKQNNLLQTKIHQLQGSFQVCCRTRPMSPKERNEEGEPSVESVSETNVICGDKEFSLDSVWGPDQSQQEVFQDVEPLALSVVDGKNATIFSYGQTGSGKTYTMEGISIPTVYTFFRALERHKQDEKTMGILMKSGSQGDTKPSFEYRIEVSMIEIYNEEVYDLLTSGQKASLNIRSVGGRTVAEGATKIHITSIEDFTALVEQGNDNRSTAATDMNEHSSRSHMILMVDVCSTSGNIVNKGTLSLVDLAGSERVKKSNVEGDRKKEACKINQSLSTLGKVMLALEKKDKHIPYRDSKLTHLLQDCLNGKSSTLLIATLSPVASSVGESLNTLEFATRVRGISFEAAKRNKADVVALATNTPKPKRLPSLACSTTKRSNLTVMFNEKKNGPPETPSQLFPASLYATTGKKKKKPNNLQQFLSKLSPSYRLNKHETHSPTSRSSCEADMISEITCSQESQLSMISAQSLLSRSERATKEHLKRQQMARQNQKTLM